jgi:putative phosphoesterase
MRIAVVSDIHANLTALEAVIADLRKIGADLVVHGGDLMAGGARPAEVIDRVRELNWPGVCGNTDEMLWMPRRISETLHAPHLHRIRDLLLTYTIPTTLGLIGDERLDWLMQLPRQWSEGHLSVVHAAPDDPWTIVAANSPDEELERVYGVLKSTHVVYGHIHTPFVRRLPTFTLVNSGAVSQSYDGDPRAAYALIEDGHVEIRRVEYDVEDEVRLLLSSADPFAESTAATLRTGRYVPVA